MRRLLYVFDVDMRPALKDGEDHSKRNGYLLYDIIRLESNGNSYLYLCVNFKRDSSLIETLFCERPRGSALRSLYINATCPTNAAFHVESESSRGIVIREVRRVGCRVVRNKLRERWELLSCLGRRRSVRFAGNVFFPARRKFRRCEAAAAVEPRGDTAPGEFPRKLSKKLLAFVIGEREREREREECTATR